MAMFGRLVKLARSAQGRRLLNQAQKAARDPRNRERLQGARDRLRSGKIAPASDPRTGDARQNESAATGGGDAPGGGAGGRAGAQADKDADRASGGDVGR